MASPETKNNFSAIRDKILAQSGKEYWRSVEEFVDAPEFEEFVAREYPHEIEEWDNSLSRRNFVKVMGASLALAGLSGCVVQPAEKIVPYVRPNEDLLPGKPLFFAVGDRQSGRTGGDVEREVAAFHHRLLGAVKRGVDRRFVARRESQAE